MAVTKDQIAALYVAAFQRAPAQNELDAWYQAEQDKDINQAAADIAYAAYQAVNSDVTLAQYYPSYTKLSDVTTDIPTLEEFVASIYETLFGKGLDEDKEGIDGWVSKIIQDGGTFEAIGKTIAGIIYVANEIAAGNISADDTTLKYAKAFQNRVQVAVKAGTEVPSNDLNGDGKPDIEAFRDLILKVTDDPTTVTNAESVIEELAKEAQTVTDKNLIKITEDARTITGTDGDDYFDATDSIDLINGKIVNDPSTTDNDLLKAYVSLGDGDPTSTDAVNATIMNVEQVQMVGKYTGFNLNASTLTGVKELDLSTEIGGKDVVVSNIRADGVAKVVVDSSVNVAYLSADSSGTAGTLEVEANGSVDIAGAVSKDDSFDVTIGNDKTFYINDGLADDNDVVTLNLVGNPTIQSKVDGSGNPYQLKKLVLNSGTENYTVTTNTANVDSIVLQGTGVVLDVVDEAGLSGISISEDGDNVSSEVKLDWNPSTDTTMDVTKWKVDKISLMKDLTKDPTKTSNNDVNFEMDGIQQNTVVEVNTEQTSTIAGAITLQSTSQINLDLKASIDGSMVVDTPVLDITADGGNLAGLDGNSANTTQKTSVVISGNQNIDLGTVGAASVGGIDSISTDNYLQNLTLANGDGTANKPVGASTIVAGYGDDNITNYVDGVTIDGSAGNDVINFLMKSVTDDNTIKGGAGNDTIMIGGNGTTVPTIKSNLTIDGGDGDDVITQKLTLDSQNPGTVSINAGDGNDTITVADATTLDAGDGNDIVNWTTTYGGKVTLGTGADQFVYGGISTAGETVEVTDFGTTEDKIVWTKAITDSDFTFNYDDVNNKLVGSSATVPSYSTGNNYSTMDQIKLDNVTTADWSSFATLGTASNPVDISMTTSASEDMDVVGSAGNDYVNFANLQGNSTKLHYDIKANSGFDTFYIGDTTNVGNLVIQAQAAGGIIRGKDDADSSSTTTNITETNASLTNLTDTSALVNAIGELSSALTAGTDYLVVLTGEEVKVAGDATKADTVLVYVHASKSYDSGDLLSTQDVTPIGVIVDQTDNVVDSGILADTNFATFA
jgi:hypothetical protein